MLKIAPRLVFQHSRHHIGAARHTNRRRVVMAIKGDPICGQLIDVRRLHILIAITAEGIRCLIIGKQKDNVRALGGRGDGRTKDNRNQRDQIQTAHEVQSRVSDSTKSIFAFHPNATSLVRQQSRKSQPGKPGWLSTSDERKKSDQLPLVGNFSALVSQNFDCLVELLELDRLLDHGDRANGQDLAQNVTVRIASNDHDWHVRMKVLQLHV